MPKFNYIRISEFARQLRLGPSDLRRRQIDRAEQLLAKIEPAKEYPYEFIYHWITDTQTPASRRTARPLMLAGRKLLADIGTLILELSDSLDIPRTDFPPDTISLEDLARQYHVTTKTIARWRKRGLSARRAVFPDGRRRLVFLPSSLRQFTARHGSMVTHGSSFRRLSPRQTREIIDRARALFQQETITPHQICIRLARQEGRAVETIRSILRRHDRLNKDHPVFPPANNRLSDQQKEDLFTAFSQHVPLAELTRRFSRSRSSIYRMINEIRSKRLRTRTIEYVYSPQFDLPGFADHLEPLAPAPGPSRPRPRWGIQDLPAEQSLPEYLRQLCEDAPLTHPQELQLFRLYNYLKFRADILRRGLGPYQNPIGLIDKIESLLIQADQFKNRIIAANMRLVVSIAKRHLAPRVRLFELISDGNISLMHAIEKFDYSRRYRFSTYATWAISRNYARTISQKTEQLEHFITGLPAMLDVAGDGRGEGELLKPEVLAQKDLLEEILQVLEPRERHILTAHFGLNEREKPQSLEAIGLSLGLTKERTRQIQTQALRKLRRLLSPQDSPDAC